MLKAVFLIKLYSLLMQLHLSLIVLLYNTIIEKQRKGHGFDHQGIQISSVHKIRVKSIIFMTSKSMAC